MVAGVIVAIIVVAALAAVMATKVGNIVLFEDDQHYQLVPIGTLTESAANTFTTSPINTTGDMTAVMTSQQNGVGVEMVVNGFGKGKHGLSVWDVKEFVVAPLGGVDVDAGDNQLDYAISFGDAPTTSPPVPSSSEATGWVMGNRIISDNQEVSAVGEIFAIQKVFSDGRWAMPQEIIGGDSVHYLMTEEDYHVSVLGTGQAAATALTMAMYARRVMIELNEVFFDRGDVKELLNAVLLQGLLD